MGRLVRWLKMPWPDRLLLVRAVFWVVLARISLLLAPLRMLRCFAHPPVSSRQCQEGVRLHVWAIRAAARRVPAATCLTQALALKWMLARSGYESAITIGVNRDPGGGFTAHAWVERDGEIILGAQEASKHSRILVW